MSCSLHLDADGQVRVEGAIDFHSVIALRQQGEALLDAADRELCFDFAAVSQINTAALSLLLCWKRYADARQRAIRFIHLPSELHSVAAVSELETLLR